MKRQPTTAFKKRTRSRRGAPWRLSELARLGKTPDSVLARRFGRTIKEVMAIRQQRYISLPTGPRRWTAREIRLLGTMNDYEPERLLGTTSDTQIAGHLGCSIAAVCIRRQKFGIPNFCRKRRRSNEI